MGNITAPSADQLDFFVLFIGKAQMSDCDVFSEQISPSPKKGNHSISIGCIVSLRGIPGIMKRAEVI